MHNQHFTLISEFLGHGWNGTGSHQYCCPADQHQRLFLERTESGFMDHRFPNVVLGQWNTQLYRVSLQSFAAKDCNPNRGWPDADHQPNRYRLRHHVESRVGSGELHSQYWNFRSCRQRFRLSMGGYGEQQLDLSNFWGYGHWERKRRVLDQQQQFLFGEKRLHLGERNRVFDCSSRGSLHLFVLSDVPIASVPRFLAAEDVERVIDSC
jgi:hypothetical protein